ncbi:MAG: penicillin-binding protein 1A [bacterium]
MAASKKIIKLSGILLAVLITGAVIFYYSVLLEIPNIDSLKHYRPNQITYLYDRNGKEFAQFSIERRILFPISRMPRKLIDAFISVEDARFYRHKGLDWVRVSGAIWANIEKGRYAQGASTITQQLARALFLTPKKTLLRKFQEAILSIRIEQSYTKQDILELYLNQIYFGHGNYGIEAASLHYFGKSCQFLDLAECAALAALPKAPNTYSPLRHPERSLKRRRIVLRLMKINNKITEEEYKAAVEEKLVLKRYHDKRIRFPFFAEYVRRILKKKYGSSQVYRGGLRVYTTMDPFLQKEAVKQLKRGLEELDIRQGLRPVEHPEILEKLYPVPPDFQFEKNRKVLGWISEVNESSIKISLKGEEREELYKIDKSDYEWLLSYDFGDILIPGKPLLLKVVKVSAGKGGVPRFKVVQEPRVQGALVCLEAATGKIMALVGGYDFVSSKFNRAIQAKRQPGSAFKPLIYGAALTQGHTLGDLLLDTAEVYRKWRPANYEDSFSGETTFRTALEHSKNVVTIKLLQKIGVPFTIKFARKLGIKAKLSPDLSLALGTSGISLMDMTSLYSVFANNGNRAEPYVIQRITDSRGKIVWEAEPVLKRVLDEDTAYLITSMLEGVVTHGTGWRAKALGRPVAGKTGTTNQNVDAWFIGFSPDILTGVWVGFDRNKSLGKQETGSRAASPIWTRFMYKALRKKIPRNFALPSGIIRVAVDRKSGLLATRDCADIIMEDFKVGTEPTTRCNRHKPTAKEFMRFDLDSREKKTRQREISRKQANLAEFD